VPPLRERVEEIEPLAERFLTQAREQWNCHAHRISEEARAALHDYAWPGNVRQLKNVIERAAVVCLGEVIGIDDLPEALAQARRKGSASPAVDKDSRSAGAPPSQTHVVSEAAENDGSRSCEARVRAFEARLIREALQKTSGNRTKAAELLQMPRRTLGTKLQALDITGGEGGG
jgi:two-component system response regulator AtoC